MLLKNLIKNLPEEKKKINIRGLEVNSKKIRKNFIYFAIKGYKLNGEDFIDEAIKKGANVIVCSKKSKYKNKKLVVIKTSNIRNFLSEISAKFYKLKPKNIFAVTGTNGKTSVSDLFHQILSQNKIPVASIGTLGIKIKNEIIKSDLTSPDTIFLHKMLQKIKKKKIENVIIEASSHGLHQKRIDHLKLKAGIFTNFSQDHLDYHKSMKSYLDAKLHLFKKILQNRKAIISDKSIKEFSKLKKISKQKNLRLIDISHMREKVKKIVSSKLNEFQIKNLSMAAIAAKMCNVKETKIFSSFKNLKDVDGRLELVKVFSNNIKVYIDFAHTPDALKKSLEALKIKHGENISLVFGCGGDRDIKKRPLMAKIANNTCHKIYVTDDNPRNERPEKIRNELTKNIKIINCYNIGDRKKAIKLALLNAEPNEVILIAGKGHESKQIYKNKTISISDKQIIKSLKLKIKKLSYKDQNFRQNKKIIKEINKGIKVQNFHGLSIDSRSVKRNNLFLTIKGKNNDGSNFIPSAIKKGAIHIISSKKIKNYENKLIKVSNEVNFLNEFATKKRENTQAKIIAITGSAGKTSLKNLVKDLLQNYGKTFGSPKSYNNHFGVPLSLSELTSNHKYGVFEVGMSRPGEINKLTNMIKPQIGVITNIGEAHIENFNDLKGIADAKGEIISNITKGGTIILNRDDKFFNYLSKKAEQKKLNIISFGVSRKSDVHPISIKKNKKYKILTVKIMKNIVRIKINNLNVYNVLSSLALINELNLNLSKITNCFKIYEPTEGRGKIHKIKRYKKNFNLIDESYNSNPLSVKNAIRNFNSIKKQKFKKYLFIGDMLELGKKTEKFHKELSKVINNSDIDKVFIKGEKTLITYKNIHKNKRGNIFQKEEDVDFTLNNIIANNDYLMIKGSNATGLNNISKKMIRGY